MSLRDHTRTPSPIAVASYINLLSFLTTTVSQRRFACVLPNSVHVIILTCHRILPLTDLLTLTSAKLRNLLPPWCTSAPTTGAPTVLIPTAILPITVAPTGANPPLVLVVVLGLFGAQYVLC